MKRADRGPWLLTAVTPTRRKAVSLDYKEPSLPVSEFLKARSGMPD